jgi:hypothetical protein
MERKKRKRGYTDKELEGSRTSHSRLAFPSVLQLTRSSANAQIIFDGQEARIMTI